MKRKIVVVISLNTLGFDEKRFDENWLKYRIDIFMKYTRKSLESQTYQGFMAIVSH